MKILLVDNIHFYKTPDGRLYTPSIYDASFFGRYLEVFDQVYVLAKTRHVEHLDKESYIHVDIDRLHIIEIPWYSGLREMLSLLPQLIHVYYHAGSECSGAIYRVCQIESFLSFLLQRKRQPFFLEVVNDPETFSTMPAWARHINIAMLRLMLFYASGASFVTEHILQRKYLPKRRELDPRYLKSHYSSVEIRSTDFGQARRFGNDRLDQLHIVHVANSISNDIKGHITVILTLEKLTSLGRNAKVEFIGDGPFVNKLKRFVSERPSIVNRVLFSGRFHNRQMLFERLCTADIFLYPTQLEGLPRSLIEAMAAGLPALSTPIAGIPELLTDDCLFDPHDSVGFSERLSWLMDNPRQLEIMSQRNLAIARQYENTQLNARRRKFYTNIKEKLTSTLRKNKN